MNILLLVCVVGVAVGASGYRVQRQDDVVVEVEDQPLSDSDAPYPASGYLPARQFLLPQQQQQQQHFQSNPRTLLFPDADEAPTTTELPTTTDMPSTTTDLPSTTPLPTTAAKLSDARAPDSDVEEVEATDEQKNVQNDQGQAQQGVYYVLLPGGQLQKVQYGQAVRVDDVRRARYAAEYLQQIQGPVYAYDPQAAFLQVVAK